MDEDLRTVWCGNLSEKVSEELLYELFLQGGPVQRVTIPKDRDGKQKAYGFVTYKHSSSVLYALAIFEGTILFNRALAMSPRKGTESPQNICSPQDNPIRANHWLQLGQEILLGNGPNFHNMKMNLLPNRGSNVRQIDNYSQMDNRKSRRVHPYQREQNKSSNHYRDHRSSRSHNNHKPNDSSKHNYRNNKRSYY